jgi:4a-hydroxytetrahydrobiopterin dehydratase
MLSLEETFVASDLADLRCVPCRADTPPLEGRALESLLDRLGGGWRAVDGHHLEKDFRFPDFRSALEFTGRVGDVADEQDHHPDVHLSWGRARVCIWTHRIDGLTESDFVLAAKIDRVSGQAEAR